MGRWEGSGGGWEAEGGVKHPFEKSRAVPSVSDMN